MTPLDTVRAALREAGCDPRGYRTQYTCRCPAHDDRTPSLSVGVGEDDRVLLNCHAGCTPEQITAALGMKLSDLFAREDGHKAYRSERAAPPAPVPKPAPKPGKAHASAADAIAYCSQGLHCEPTDQWNYHDAAGSIVGVVARWDIEGEGKTYRPVSLIEGAWRCTGMPEPRPLYQLPDLVKEETVYVVEGEKCADIAWTCGLPATTSAHGAKAAQKTDWSPVAGKHVVILPDNHDAGMEYAETVARLCHDAGAASVRLVNLADRWPEIPEGGDIEQALKLEGADAEATRRAIEALADGAESFNAPRTIEPPERSVYMPFPVDAFPDPLRSFVSEAGAAINCDPSFVALPLLSALASAIGNTHVAEIKRGYQAPSILWTAIIGESGTAKSPAMKAAVRPLREIQTRALTAHLEEVKAWEPEHQRWEVEMAKWKRKPGSAPPPPEPERPICSRWIVSDTTVEALAPLLRDNPRGLLMAHDELSGWIGSFDRYVKGKGGDVAHWLSIHDASSLMVDRKTSGTLIVPRASVSVTGGIQPGALKRALGKALIENGLAMRILFAHPPRRVREYTDAEVSERATAEVARVFDRLIALQGESVEGDVLKPRALRMSAEAMGLWEKYVNANGRAQAEHTGAIASVYSKLESAAARIALIVELVEAGNVANGASVTVTSGATEISASSLESGITLARWFTHEAIRVFQYLDETEEDTEIRTITDWIAQRDGNVSVREITRGFRRYRRRDDAKAVAEKLVSKGFARWDKSDGRGDRLVLQSHYGDGDSGDTGATSRHAESRNHSGDGDTGDTSHGRSCAERR